MSGIPQTRYAKSGPYHIAYQVIGNGPLDIVFVPGFVSHVEYAWENAQMSRYFARLASFSRLIIFDKRGTGMSDPVPVERLPSLEERMDDVRAVMDAAGSQRAALIGMSEGGPMSLLFAATYPERTAALVVAHTFARIAGGSDYPTGASRELQQALVDRIESGWGNGVLLGAFARSMAQDAEMRAEWARFQRRASSPGAAVALMRMMFEIDVRAVLPVIRVPTLVVHRASDALVPLEHARFIAERIPGARLVSLPGVDHFFFLGSAAQELDEIELFVTGELRQHSIDRILSTILFADISGSTERAAQLGDSRWRQVLEGFYAIVRGQLARFRGSEIDTAGDGVFAAFDGPARAVRCAGVHTGECEVINSKIGGIAVHIGARVASLAQPGEVLVSTTVKDLVAGSGISFEDRGLHPLKGVPEPQRLYSLAGA